MSDNVSVSGPVSVQSDSKERVAYDLMLRISNQEKTEKSRRYYLELYSQCRQVVTGTSIQYVEPKV